MASNSVIVELRLRRLFEFVYRNNIDFPPQKWSAVVRNGIVRVAMQSQARLFLISNSLKRPFFEAC